MMHASLNGKWRIAQRPALILSLLGIIGAGLLAWLPKDLEVLRITGLAFGMFATGMLASQHAAIWERSDNGPKPTSEESTENRLSGH